jgi:hypothetical protein
VKSSGVRVIPWVIFSVVCLLMHCLLGSLMVLAQGEVPEDAEFMVLRREKRPHKPRSRPLAGRLSRREAEVSARAFKSSPRDVQ